MLTYGLCRRKGQGVPDHKLFDKSVVGCFSVYQASKFGVWWARKKKVLDTCSVRGIGAGFFHASMIRV